MNTKIEEIEKKEALGRVVGDAQRLSYEKETVIRFNRSEKILHISTFDPTIVKGLLRHKHFEVLNYNTNKQGMITGISGQLPRGVIKIKKEPRKRDYLCTIISSEASEG